MRILVAGATGTVGQHVVTQALERGYTVTAVARRPKALHTRHPRLTVIGADILDAEQVKPLLEGIDAVISTVGVGTSKTPTTLYSQGTRNLVDAMANHQVERIVVISSEVAEHWAHQGLLKLWIVLPLLQRFLGATYDDMRRMDTVLWESHASWTTVRAPRIRDAKRTGRYRIDSNHALPRGWSIAAPDLATALLDITERGDLARQFVFIAS